MDKTKKVFWCFPWGYRESMAVSMGILFCGILLDYTLGTDFQPLKFPYNLIAGSILIIALLLLYVFKKNNLLVKWLYSYYAAILSVSLFGFVSVLMALIPQSSRSEFFLYNLTSSYTYYLSYLFLLIILGMVSLKRLIPFKIRNIGFIFSHLGLWIALFAAGIGHGDMEKLTMYLQEGSTVWFAQDENNNKVELPLAIKLNDFDIDEYNSKLALISNSNGEIVCKKGKPYVVDIVRNKFMKILDYTIKIKQYYKYSMLAAGSFQPIIKYGAVSSALIETAGDKKWICSSGLKSMPKTLKLNDKHSLVLLKPGPKRFFSLVTVYEKDGVVRNETIQVNKPIAVKGWKIYQQSYDKTKGKWSGTSIVELVKDPWLNIVYLGCILIILGAFDMIWRGRKRNLKLH